MDEAIKFSVIIPTYNRSSLVMNAIHSVLDQTYKNLECIVIDDGSIDETEENILRIKDERLKYYKNRNYGRGYARNFGFTKSTGDYINFLDSDDELLPQHLFEANKFLLENNTPLMYQFAKIVDGNNNIVLEERVENYNNIKNDFIRNGNLFMMCGVIMSKKIFENDKFCEDRRLAVGEDYEFWLRLVFKYEARINPITTSVVYDHKGRSVREGDIEKLILSSRMLLSQIKYSENHSAFVKDKIKFIRSNSYSYVALHSALAKERYTGILFLFKSVIASPYVLMRKRFYSTLKHLVF
jgi:glycosyltransferase involved in cell wall biosynthesis